jgi:polyphosphate kinase 2 (PPK2 family)
MPSSEEERAERLFRQKQDAPKALAGLSRKARGHSQVDGEAARRTFGTRSATGEDGSVKKVTKKLNPTANVFLEFEAPLLPGVVVPNTPDGIKIEWPH